MGRIHAFEFNDQPWLPQAWRDYMTDFLQFGANLFNACEPAVPILLKGLKFSSTQTIIDLGSGGGGGLLQVAKAIRRDAPGVTIRLTDLFPNVKAFANTVDKYPEVFLIENQPVNAMQVPETLPGLRTMFMSFHHFKPADASRILSDAVKARMPIAIFEVQQRNFPSIIPMLLSPLNLFLSTPFIRPFRPERLVWTYLLPVIPLITIWDGIISVLRTYTADEMKAMAESVPGGETFRWETGVAGSGPAKVLYLLGVPLQ